MLRTLSTTIICLLIMLIAAPSQAKLGYAETVAAVNFSLAERLFSFSGATLEEIKLKYWGQISNKRDSLTELETKYCVLVQTLGLDPAKKTVQIDSDGFISMSQLEILAGDAIQIFIQSIPVQESEGATYWGVSIRTTAPEQAEKYYELLRRAMGEMGSAEEPGIDFSGNIPGSRSVINRALYLQQLAKFADAQYVEGINSGNLVSLSLFTKEGVGGVLVQGQMVNLNLALRSIPTENETKLHIGIPLIYSDY